MKNIAVIGGHTCSRKDYQCAYELGKLIAQKEWVLICGGGAGIMEAAAKGVYEEGGITVGILPTYDSKMANPYIKVKIPTGFGYGRNIFIVRAADFVVAVSGSYGTLSEIAFSLNENKPIIGINTWKIKGLKQAKTPQEAIRKIVRWKK